MIFRSIAEKWIPIHLTLLLKKGLGKRRVHTFSEMATESPSRVSVFRYAILVFAPDWDAAVRLCLMTVLALRA
jgi:hypothetical protein